MKQFTDELYLCLRCAKKINDVSISFLLKRVIDNSECDSECDLCGAIDPTLFHVIATMEDKT